MNEFNAHLMRDQITIYTNTQYLKLKLNTFFYILNIQQNIHLL